MKSLIVLFMMSLIAFGQVAEPSGGGYPTNTYAQEADEMIEVLRYVKQYGHKLFSGRRVKIETVGAEGSAMVVKALRYNSQDRLQSRTIYLVKPRQQVGYDISGINAFEIEYDSDWK